MGLRCVGTFVVLTSLWACGDSPPEDTPPPQDTNIAVDTLIDVIHDSSDTGLVSPPDAQNIDEASPDDLGWEDADTSDSELVDIGDEPDDASQLDSKDSQAEEIDVQEIIEDTSPPASELNVFFTAPSAGSTIELNQSFDVVVLTKDLLYGPEALEVVISSSIEGELATLTPDFAGWASTTVTLTKPGWHQFTAKVINPGGEEFVQTIEVGICSYGQPESFDVGMIDPSWKVYGDAYFDNGGWLEMTGNAQGKHGAIYNVGDKVNPGDVELSFKIWTGEGLNSGADGFAMSVINVPTVFELEEVINMGASGGCLGYGVSGNCGPLTIDSFHVEFDTWKNDGNPNFDPAAGNHIAITLDGDPSNHAFWEAVVLEDAQWHDVVITIVGQNITVHFDGEQVIKGDLPAFQFHGGFIGFSGTTGWATNYHRFDDLLVKQACEVP